MNDKNKQEQDSDPDRIYKNAFIFALGSAMFALVDMIARHYFSILNVCN